MSVATTHHSALAQEQELVCWTRMQSEAGQGLNDILFRKELERRSGDGIFFWGVGNAPSVATSTYARLRVPVKVIFSIMKSRPKAIDAAPHSVMVWRRYLDMHGSERDLPPQALITSRGETLAGDKRRHYALMCYSADPLRLKRGESFDPFAYRNVGRSGGPVGASQVTAMLQKVMAPAASCDYEANLTAELIGSYWVRLTDPVALDAEGVAQMQAVRAASPQEWLRLVSNLRQRIRPSVLEMRQPRLPLSGGAIGIGG